MVAIFASECSMCSQYPTLVFRKKCSNNRNSAYHRRDKLKTQILKPTASCSYFILTEVCISSFRIKTVCNEISLKRTFSKTDTSKNGQFIFFPNEFLRKSFCCSLSKVETSIKGTTVYFGHTWTFALKLFNFVRKIWHRKFAFFFFNLFIKFCTSYFFRSTDSFFCCSWYFPW